MSTGGGGLRAASFPPGAGGGAAGRLRGPLGGLELSLRMLPSLPGCSNLPDSSRPPTGWRMLRVLPWGTGVGGIGGSSCPSRSDIAGRPVSVSVPVPVSVSVSISVSSSRARTTRCPRRKSEPSSSAISEGEPSRGAPAGSPEGPGCPLGSAGGASTAATAALRSSEQSWSAPSAPGAGDPSLRNSRLGCPRCLTCVCASACCCRVARARSLQVRHSSRLYAELFAPGSTPSLPPCHAPQKLTGLQRAGAAQQVRAPELLREGRGRLQARLANREALVDRHALRFCSD